MADHLHTRIIDDTNGVIVFLGYRRGRGTGEVYVGWIPTILGPLEALLKTVRKSRSLIEVLHLRSGSVDDVVQMKKNLCCSWSGIGDWFERTGPMASLLEAMWQEECAALVAHEREEERLALLAFQKGLTINQVRTRVSDLVAQQKMPTKKQRKPSVKASRTIMSP